MTARTEETERAYQTARAANDLQALDEIKPIREWTHWKLVENRFPHDKLNARHYILVLKRKIEPKDYWGLTEYELYELWWDIFPEVDNEFHYVKINLAGLRSVNNVPHVHLCDHLPEFV